ncbi:hypothetical protein [Vibrio splendidus]|uniref:Uncharacterized protein n=1 Tax=Vibrio splendidus TaxID=29497 RepID=A0A2N7JPG6_VIBSP|nr:hypothetical protein [Vibrio splendidus]PMM47617.1 hypothetical protein BCT54_25125 [Vibrio splendidus]
MRSYYLALALALSGCTSTTKDVAVVESNGVSSRVKFGSWSVIYPNAVDSPFAVTDTFYYLHESPSVMVGCLTPLSTLYLSLGTEGYVGEHNSQVSVVIAVKGEEKDYFIERVGTVKDSAVVVLDKDRELTNYLSNANVMAYKVQITETKQYSNAVDLNEFPSAVKLIKEAC